ncbi:MAG: GumC family protein [Oceanococcus sp.]
MNLRTSIDNGHPQVRGSTNPTEPNKAVSLSTLGGVGTDVVNIFAIIRQNLLVLLSLPLCAALIGMYAALAQPPIYRADTLLQLDPKPMRTIGKSEDFYDPGYDSFKYYGTQLTILESRKLAKALTERLDLVNVEEFGGTGFREARLREKLLSFLPGMPDAPPPVSIDDGARLESTIEKVRKASSSRLAPNTTLFLVSFVSLDPKLAATAANTLADLYIEELLQSRLDIYAKANLWLVGKLGDVESQMGGAESALQTFRDTNNLLNVGGNRSLVESEQVKITAELRTATRERRQIENAHQEILSITSGGKNPADARPLLSDDVIRGAWQSLASADAILSTLEKRYGTRHPEYVSAAARKAALEQEYLSQLENKARSIKSKLDIARRTEANLIAEKARSESRLRDLDKSEFKLNMLERDVKTNQQLYDLFLARFQQSESNSSFSEANARIADPAVPPRRPFAPSAKQYAFLGGLLGIVLALFITVLRELLRSKIETPDDLESITRLPLLGILPRSKSKLLEKSVIDLLRNDARAPFADAVRSLKTAVLLGGKFKPEANQAAVVAITSTEPGEGKTTLTAALASVFADTSRVLIIDGDMRRPKMARQFKIKNSSHAGLAEMLQGKAEINTVVQQYNEENLFFVTAGTPPANPALLIDSPMFSNALNQWRNSYDYIFIDTPPLLAASDALHLADRVDTFILLARSEVTHKKGLIGAIKRLDAAAANCMGVVLNDASTSRAGYSGNYYYTTGYRY